MRDKAKGLVTCQRCRAFSECKVIHPITPAFKCAALGRVESELLGLLGKP